MIWAPGGLLQASPSAVLAACALVAAGWIALRSLFLRFGVTAGGPALAGALASLAFCADFASRPAQDIRVGVAVVVVAWVAAFAAGKRQLEIKVDVAAVGLALLLLVPLAFITVTTALWDETGGHAPLVFSAVQGVLPAEHPSFPGIPFPYHTGFDVLAAVFIVVGVRPMGAALDVATLFTAVACLWCLFDLGRALAGRRNGLAAMVLGLLSHGPLSVFGSAVFALPVPTLPGFQDPEIAPPPPVSSLFQHPQGFAMSVAPSVLLLAAADHLGARIAGLVLLLLLVPVHVVGFALTFAGSALLCLRRPHRAWFAAGHVVVGGLALVVSGFGGSGGLIVAGGFFGSLGSTVVGNALFFPAVLLLAVAAWRARRTLSPLATGVLGLVAVGFMIGNLFHYSGSWDIVKFLSFSSYFSTILLFSLCDGSSTIFSRLARVIVITGAAVGVLWVLRFGPLNGAGFSHYDVRPVNGFARAAAPHLHPHLGPRDCVITQASSLRDVGVRGGGIDIDKTPEYAVDRARARAAYALWQRAVDGDVEAMEATGCRFALFPPETAPPPGSRMLDRFSYSGDTWTLYGLE